MTTSRHLTIFEGCDGGGKTTAAKAYAAATGAKYVHFPALPRVTHGLARMYVEAMLPALLGYQDVVFDRSWLSEGPYGTVFREGQDRLGHGRRMLERLALRCGAAVVWCDPGWEAIEASYQRRSHLEMLKDTSQLRQVYDLYSGEPTDLEEVIFDYTQGPLEVSRARPPRHPVDLHSAGRWDAPIVLVGDRFAERKDQDPFYQWPFASFSNQGCSQWLASQLEAVEQSEHELLWLNADMDLSCLTEKKRPLVVALGTTAAQILDAMGIEATTVPHPQHAKRFNPKARYKLLDLLQQADQYA